MKPFGSIRWRLQLWYGLLIAGLLTICGLTAYHLERSERLERTDEELQRLAYAINGTQRRPPPPPRGEAPRREARPPLALEDVFTPDLRERGFYYAIWTRNFAPFRASPGAPADIPLPEGDSADLRTRGTWRETSVSTNPGDVTLVGRDIARELADLRAFGWKLAAGGLVLLIVALLTGSWLVTRALRPVHDIGAAAQKIATGDLSQRINTRDTESELGQLAAVLNSTFARLDAAFAQQARFTADAAHELRTPLSVVLMHTQNALAGERLSDEQRQALEAAQRAAQRMRQLIESLLRLARIDSGQGAVPCETLDIAAVVRESMELVAPLAIPRGIAIQTDLAPAPTCGDREGLGQVVTNLLTNAVHHNRDGGEVWVRTRVESGRAILIVADNGPGIAPEHLPHVFERFYRADKARTAHLGRTGLGLAIARAIVQAHGGEIEAKSASGAGAEFVMRLPAAPE